MAGLGADLVCLQEVTERTSPMWVDALAAAGLVHVVLAEVAAARAAGRARPLRVLTAAREPLDRLPVAGLPWPERVLSVRRDALELVNVHSPISSKPDLAKVRTHEAVHRHLREEAAGPRVVCGDLNTPRREHPDGKVWTFARSRSGRLRPERGERWDAAELALIRGLEPHGFRDAFRALHGPERRELSWEWPRTGGGYRLDHLIASTEVSVPQLAYGHDWRLAGLSDHSPLVADLEW